ncbi:MAG: type 4a pilus biogenesis protein PilO [bacterium]
MRLNQRQIDITFAAAGLMIILGYLLMFQRPVNRKLKELRSEIRILSESSLSVEGMEAKLEQLNQTKDEINREIASLEAAFFKADRLWDLMQSLSNMAEDAGLTVILVQPQLIPKSDQYQQGSLLIRLNGDFLSFYRFLAIFEKSTPSLKANTLKIIDQAEANVCLEEVQFDLTVMSPP